MRRASVAGALLLVALHAAAAPRRADVALPFYTPLDHAQGLRSEWLEPRLAAFAIASAELTPAIERLCASPVARAADALRDARAAWARSTHAWETVSTVAVGALLERRSARRIDFTPPRPELIARAIAAEPADVAAFERIGSPAKGLPALEWLLWRQPVQPGSPSCRYAALAARDVADEAATLHAAQLSAPALDEDSGAALFGETLNQWIGGLEALRWRDLERPLRSAGGRAAAALPRAASGETGASWAAQWQALRRLAIALPADAAPLPGTGLVSLETYLRGRGLNPLADALRRDVARADAALQGLRPGQPARMQAAARALAALKRRVQDEVAPALQVSVGFSNADGD